MIYYPDTNILIYSIEQNPVWGAMASAYLRARLALGDTFAISDFTRMECQVGPLITGNVAILNQYLRLFQSPDVRVLPLTAGVYDRAAFMRAKYRFKTPDAIHLAAAIEHGCDRFLTNDTRLQACTEITVELLA